MQFRGQEGELYERMMASATPGSPSGGRPSHLHATLFVLHGESRMKINIQGGVRMIFTSAPRLGVPARTDHRDAHLPPRDGARGQRVQLVNPGHTSCLQTPFKANRYQLC